MTCASRTCIDGDDLSLGRAVQLGHRVSSESRGKTPAADAGRRLTSASRDRAQRAARSFVQLVFVLRRPGEVGELTACGAA